MVKLFSDPATTLTVAVPLTLPTVAVTYLPTAGVVCAISIFPTIVPALVLQVALIGMTLPTTSEPEAVNVLVIPTVTVTGSGLTRMLANGPVVVT
jgi:hypothetical protein